MTDLLETKAAIAPLQERSPVLTSPRTVPASWHAYKRSIDLVLGSLLCLLFAPFVIAAIIAIVVASPGSPFFIQERVGLRGRIFKMYKLRTMVAGAHEMREDLGHLNEADGPVFKIRNDPRLHALGPLLRKLSIDEMPNILNVLKGEMSLVGPRPPLPCEVVHYGAYAARRLTMKPGITCLWQISGRSTISFEEWMVLDNAYIDSWSPLGDCMIIAKTLPAVIKGVGAH